VLGYQGRVSKFELLSCFMTEPTHAVILVCVAQIRLVNDVLKQYEYHGETPHFWQVTFAA